MSDPIQEADWQDPKGGGHQMNETCEVQITVQFQNEEAAKRFGSETLGRLEDRLGSESERPISVDYHADLPSTRENE